MLNKILKKFYNFYQILLSMKNYIKAKIFEKVNPTGFEPGPINWIHCLVGKVLVNKIKRRNLFDNMSVV